MSLRIRRGTEAQRTSIVFDAGELIYTTDTKRLYVGDGITSGGTAPEQNIVGNGLSYNTSTKHIDVSLATFSSDSLTEGSNNRYFTNQRAQDAFGALVANGTFSGVTVQYDSVAHALNITVAGDYDAVVMDTNPQLGGNLSLNSHNIGGTGNISITGNITATGGTITAPTFSATGSITSPSYTGVLTTNTVAISSSNIELSNFYGINTDGAGINAPAVGIDVSRGTLAAPVATQAGDVLGLFQFRGYYGGQYVPAVTIRGSWDASSVLTNQYAGGTFLVATGNNSSGFNTLTFSSKGTLASSGAVQVGQFATGSYPATPAKGMIIFDSTTNHFFGYNGTTWQQFA